MTREEIHEDDIGTKFLLTVRDDDGPVDISSASVKKIIFEKPDKTIVEKTASFETDGSDGKIYYITEDPSILDKKGYWRIQAEITMGGGTWRSSVETFHVYDNLE